MVADGAEQLREILPKGEAWAEAAVAFGGELIVVVRAFRVNRAMKKES